MYDVILTVVVDGIECEHVLAKCVSLKEVQSVLELHNYDSIHTLICPSK